jgi:hypothetical protein
VETVGKEVGIGSVLGEHIQARKKITNLGATVRASANACCNSGMRADEMMDSNWLTITAKASAHMCLNGGMRTDETVDSDWLTITGKKVK